APAARHGAQQFRPRPGACATRSRRDADTSRDQSLFAGYGPAQVLRQPDLGVEAGRAATPEHLGPALPIVIRPPCAVEVHRAAAQVVVLAGHRIARDLQGRLAWLRELLGVP